MRVIVDMIDKDDPRSPIEIIEALGISFVRCEPQPIADQWMFHGCSNIPDELPHFIRWCDG